MREPPLVTSLDLEIPRMLRNKAKIKQPVYETKLRPVAVGVVTTLLIATSSPALGQSDNPDFLKDLRECSTIEENEKRLACYDQSVGAVVAASDAGEVQIVDKEDVEQTRRGLFGFTLPKIGLFSGDSEEEDLNTLESEVTSVRRLPRDTYVFKIAEGSTWRIANAPMRLRPPRTGDKVVFKKAALGSYFIRIAGQTGVKGRRIE